MTETAATDRVPDVPAAGHGAPALADWHVQLVCEGRCNLDLVRRFDQGVRAVRSNGISVGGRALFGDDLIALARKLVHTWHRPVYQGSQVYACVDCGAERLWGPR